MNPGRKSAITIAVFAVVLFLACAICATGIISLFANRDVLAEPDTGPLIAPIMFLVATIVLFLQLINCGLRAPKQRGSIVLGSIIGAVASYVLFVLSGAVLYGLGRGQPLLSLLFFAANVFGPFAISIGVIAFIVTFGYLLLLSYRDHGASPPSYKA